MIELDAEQVLHVRPLLSVTAGIIVLFVGKVLNQHLAIFREFNIPEPVTGGLLFSTAFGVMYLLSGIKVDFELTARDILLGLGRTAVDVTLLRG
jgi:ESS family glutamate:Na+ symporter